MHPSLGRAKMMGLHPDPIAALKESGYEQHIAAERGVATGASGGFPTA